MTKRTMEIDDCYDDLFGVFLEALDRVSHGKGKERHAPLDRPVMFNDQLLCQDLRELGIAPSLFQIRKKALEVQRLSKVEARKELLDIIVHAGAAYLVLKGEEEF